MRNLIRSIGISLSVAPELLGFLWRRKLWWVIPIVVVLLAMTFILLFASSTGLGPFIYTLF